MTTKSRFLNWTVFMLIFTIVVSCTKDELKKCVEHTKASCQVDTSKTNIRIKNNSKSDFCNVTVDPSGKMTNYGIVRSGETTCYNFFDLAYQYAYVKLHIGDKEFIFQPIDYVGEQQLGQGKFTYSIAISDYDNKTLTITTTKD
jgi:hypothetical protein